MPTFVRPSLIKSTSQALGQIFKLPGELYGPGLQTAHILVCLKRAKFDNTSSDIRLRRHLMLYGPPGTIKSTASKYFLQRIAGCLDLFSPEAQAQQSFDRPVYAAWKNSTGLERLRGTTDIAGYPLDPLFQKIQWLYSPELMNTLGHSTQSRGDRMDALNGYLEEGDVNIVLTKAANLPIEERREVAKTIRREQKPYFYNPEDCSMSYNCSFSFVGCTRYLDEKVLSELVGSGYWERHTILELRPNRQEMESYSNDKFGAELDPALESELLQRNLDLWRTEFKQVNRPPRELVLKAVRDYNWKLKIVCDSVGADYTKQVSARDDLDILHLMVASAVDRISMSREPGDISPVEKLEYTDEDCTNATAWSIPKLSHIRNRLIAHTKELQAEIPGREAAVLFVAQGGTQHFALREFVKLAGKGGMAEGVAYRGFHRLLSNSHISTDPTDPEKYRMDSSLYLSLVPKKKEVSPPTILKSPPQSAQTPAYLLSKIKIVADNSDENEDIPSDYDDYENPDIADLLADAERERHEEERQKAKEAQVVTT